MLIGLLGSACDNRNKPDAPDTGTTVDTDATINGNPAIVTRTCQLDPGSVGLATLPVTYVNTYGQVTDTSDPCGSAMSNGSGGTKASISAIYSTMGAPPEVTATGSLLGAPVSMSLGVSFSEACEVESTTGDTMDTDGGSRDGYLLVQVTLPGLLFPTLQSHEMLVWLKATAFDANGEVTTFSGHGYCGSVADIFGAGAVGDATSSGFTDAHGFHPFIDLTFERTP